MSYLRLIAETKVGHIIEIFMSEHAGCKILVSRNLIDKHCLKLFSQLMKVFFLLWLSMIMIYKTQHVWNKKNKLTLNWLLSAH